MPFEEKAPCSSEQSAFGTCCCTCVFRARTRKACRHQGGTGVCGDGHLGALAATLDEGFACTYFFVAGGGEVQVDWSEHGMCEAYSERPSVGIRFELVEPPDYMKQRTENDA